MSESKSSPGKEKLDQEKSQQEQRKRQARLSIGKNWHAPHEEKSVRLPPFHTEERNRHENSPGSAEALISGAVQMDQID